jgi:hypothetical protein
MNTEDVQAVRLRGPSTELGDTQGTACSAVVVRAIAIGAICALLCACGGGGSGASDGTEVVSPPQKAELSWDNGNWDQQEWK